MSKEKKGGLGKFLVGAGIGACLGILFAPKSGKETRADLKEKMNELLEKTKNINVEEVKATIEAKVKEIKEDIKNLDKETVATVVKDQAKKIKNKAEDLVLYAKEKGTPVIEAAAREVKLSTIKTLESITAKLKDEEVKVTPKKSTKASK